MNIMFSFLYAFCYNCHQPLVFLVISSPCVVFPMCIVINCKWSFVYRVIILFLFLSPYVYFLLCVCVCIAVLHTLYNTVYTVSTLQLQYSK